MKLKILQAAMLLSMLPADFLEKMQRYSNDCRAFRRKSRAWFGRAE